MQAASEILVSVQAFDHTCRVGQNRIYTPYMAVYLVISLPKIPYINRIYMVLANPTYLHPWFLLGSVITQAAEALHRNEHMLVVFRNSDGVNKRHVKLELCTTTARTAGTHIPFKSDTLSGCFKNVTNDDHEYTIITLTHTHFIYKQQSRLYHHHTKKHTQTIYTQQSRLHHRHTDTHTHKLTT